MDIVVVTDGRRPRLFEQTRRTIEENAVQKHNIMVVKDGTPVWRGVGGTKNLGAQYIARTSPILFFSDDDMYYLKEWDQPLYERMNDYAQLSVWSHPYNHITEVEKGAGRVNACHGGGFAIKWTDWDKYGPFMANSVGPGKSEDWELSQRIVKGGGKIGCIVPFTAIHCGITNCLGEPAVGADALEMLAKRQIWDSGAKDVVTT